VCVRERERERDMCVCLRQRKIERGLLVFPMEKENKRVERKSECV